MPIYEYSCRDCGHRFEALVFGGQAPPCPECEGTKLEKLLSSFAVGSDTGAGGQPTCPTTGGG